jgi:hypothetical protein
VPAGDHRQYLQPTDWLRTGELALSGSDQALRAGRDEPHLEAGFLQLGSGILWRGGADCAMLARLLHHVTVMQISGDNDRLKDKSRAGPMSEDACCVAPRRPV